MTASPNATTEIGHRAHVAERGASLVEYTLVIMLIALLCIGAVGYFGEGVGGALDDSAVAVADAQPGN